jgi:hypothetical protein
VTFVQPEGKLSGSAVANDGTEQESQMTDFYSVSIHLYDRAYGGPEEGGWWFDYGEPDHGYWNFTRLFDNAEDARAYGNSLDGVIAELNQGRPEVSSVVSEGRYGWFVQEGYPHAWPVTRPHYE